jgi:hypothetical protein
MSANINLHDFGKARPKRKPIDSRMKKRNQIPNFKTQIDPGYKKQASKAKFKLDMKMQGMTRERC